jgi:hypothetical protein
MKRAIFKHEKCQFSNKFKEDLLGQLETKVMFPILGFDEIGHNITSQIKLQDEIAKKSFSSICCSKCQKSKSKTKK